MYAAIQCAAVPPNVPSIAMRNDIETSRGSAHPSAGSPGVEFYGLRHVMSLNVIRGHYCQMTVVGAEEVTALGRCTRSLK